MTDITFDTKNIPAPWWANGYKCDLCGLPFLTAYEWDMRHRDTHDDDFTHYRHENCCVNQENK